MCRFGPAALFISLLVPGAVLGQAEPAPGSLPSAPPRREPPPPRVRIAANARLAGLLGEAAGVAPPLGWGFGLQLSASLVPVGPLRLGFVLDFAQDRFVRTIDTVAGLPEQGQLLLHNTFVLQGLADLPTRWVRPYLAFGAGLSEARHESPLEDAATQAPQTVVQTTLPLLRLSAGLGISPLRWFEVGVSAELSFAFSALRGGVVVEGGMAARGDALLFQPGWGVLATWVSYRFF
ncbi:MAG: hypothetical protein RMK29_05000 [Myxococcales bacterium]|nr:hypothetical protein [Myxococcota bacterium]MDW8281048.1 hypothetical protein [Myxococcales bacterium]